MRSDIYAQIGSRLTHIRGDESQAKFSLRIGIHKNTLGNYERGDRELGADALAALVNLGWNANWILTGEGPERLEALPAAISGTSQVLRPDTLKMAVTLAQEALDGKTLGAADYAELVSLIYDALANGLKGAQVLAFAKPAARGLGAKNGRDAVGGSGKEVAGKG